MRRRVQSRCCSLLYLLTLVLATAGAQERQAARTVEMWPLWESYKTHFFDGHGRIIDHDDGDRTTSEAQAYGMFFALVADDRESFDRILRWTQNHLADDDLTAQLPAWLWSEKKNGTWGVVDANPASDADLWISYTLLQAGRLWSEPRYTELGKAMLTSVEETEIATLPHFGPFLVPSNNGFTTQQETILNPSYLPPQLIAAFAHVSPNSVWRKMSESLPSFLQASSRRGFAMDWVAWDAAGIIAAVPGPGKIAGGSYDAIRVYLWAGMLASDASGRSEILHSLAGMATYLQKHNSPPERVGDDGQVLSGNGNVGFSAAVIPYLSALGQAAPLVAQKSRLLEDFDVTTGLFGQDHRYYTQNLALFATGWLEQRFRFERNGDLTLAWSKP